MKIIVTNRQEITSKAGNKFVLYKGIASSGDCIDIFLSEDQEIEMGIPTGSRLKKEELEELFSKYPVVDVQFNNRGRLDTIEY